MLEDNTNENRKRICQRYVTDIYALKHLGVELKKLEVIELTPENFNRAGNRELSEIVLELEKGHVFNYEHPRELREDIARVFLLQKCGIIDLHGNERKKVTEKSDKPFCLTPGYFWYNLLAGENDEAMAFIEHIPDIHTIYYQSDDGCMGATYFGDYILDEVKRRGVINIPNQQILSTALAMCIKSFEVELLNYVKNQLVIGTQLVPMRSAISLCNSIEKVLSHDSSCRDFSNKIRNSYLSRIGLEDGMIYPRDCPPGYDPKTYFEIH